MLEKKLEIIDNKQKEERDKYQQEKIEADKKKAEQDVKNKDYYQKRKIIVDRLDEEETKRILKSINM
jgi:argininosuccinate lyase